MTTKDIQEKIFCALGVFVIAALLGAVLSFIPAVSPLLAGTVAGVAAFVSGVARELWISRRQAVKFGWRYILWYGLGAALGALLAAAASFFTTHDIHGNLLQ